MRGHERPHACGALDPTMGFKNVCGGSLDGCAGAVLYAQACRMKRGVVVSGSCESALVYYN